MHRSATVCAVVLALLPAALGAQARTPRPTGIPTLVVHITVDQMRGDYLGRYRAQYTGGLAKLLREGAVFTRAYQDHAITETAVGHATTLSGRNPAATGIIRNSEGANDPAFPLLEVRGPGASPRRFLGTALFDWMQARWPESRALSVSRKDRGAILPIGTSKQSVYWYEGGQFTTSTYYMDSLPPWVRAFNERAVAARAPGRAWELLLPPSQYAEPDSMPYENRGGAIAFPYALANDSAAAARGFLSTPWIDSLTLAFALDGLQQLNLGRGPQSDLLAISLSATDYIGHTWGPNSREIHDQLLRLDRYLGAFLDSLAKLRDPATIVLSLTGDHGITPYPEWSRGHGLPTAGYVELDTLLRRYSLSLQGPNNAASGIRFFDAGLLVLDRRGLTERGINVDSLVSDMARAIRRVPGVARANTWREIMAADTSRDAVARRWRNLVPPGFGAELFVTLRQGMYLDSVGYAQHGQPTDDDAHVPVVFWGRWYRPGTYPRRTSVVDIAPTIAQVLGIQPTERIQGRALREAIR